MASRIVTRKEWGAAPFRGTPQHVEWPPGVDLWVHHTGPGTAGQTPKEIQAFHQGPSRGWSDIGYGYLIDAKGTIYEGRGYEIHAAHSPGKNEQPSVALIGDYSTVPPNDDMHRAVYDLRRELRAGRLRGHRENTATACPGDAAFAKIVKGPPPKLLHDPRPPKKPKIPLRARLINGLVAAGLGMKSAKQATDAYFRNRKV